MNSANLLLRRTCLTAALSSNVFQQDLSAAIASNTYIFQQQRFVTGLNAARLQNDVITRRCSCIEYSGVFNAGRVRYGIDNAIGVLSAKRVTTLGFKKEISGRLYARNISATTEFSSCTSVESDSCAHSANESKKIHGVDGVREAVLDAAISYIKQHGFSESAVAAGASSLGYSIMAHGIVDNAGAELFIHTQHRHNEEMERQLASVREQGLLPQGY